jgi:hypothetical protein
MLKFPPDLRYTAQQAYTHPWIQKKNYLKLKATSTELLLRNLKCFHVFHTVS